MKISPLKGLSFANQDQELKAAGPPEPNAPTESYFVASPSADQLEEAEPLVTEGVKPEAANPAAAKRLALGTVVMGVCNAVKLGAQLALIPVIARFLGPADYGIYSLAMPSISIILMLADAGLGQSLAREDESHEVVWSSAFWLLLGFGAALTVVVSLWSIPLSMLAHQPRLPTYMVPLSLSVMLLVLSVCPSARLTRRSQIGIYSIIDLIATVTAAIAAVAAAAFGFGVWSLVIQMLCVYGLRAVALNIVAFRPPQFVFNWKSVASHTAVGGGIIVTKFTDSCGRMLEAGIVSRRFGAAAVGSYGFASQVSWSLTQSVNNPVWMAFYVRMLQLRDSKEAEVLYHRLLRLIVLLTLPVAVMLSVNSQMVVSQFLGRSWQGSALLIALIFPSQALGSAAQLSTAALYAQGRTRSQTIVAVLNASCRVAAVTIPYGGFAPVAVYIAIANVIYFFLGVTNSKRSLGWSVTGTLNALRGPFVATVAAGIEAHWVIARTAPSLAAMIVSCLMGGVTFVFVLCLLDWRRVTADLQTVRDMIKR